MYKLKNNLLTVEKDIVTPKQIAKVKETIAVVEGYDLEVELYFDSIPTKEENDMISELNYIDGELVWQYKPRPMTQEEYIESLENQLLLMEDNNVGGIL